MDIQTVLTLLRHLTSQTQLKDFVTATSEMLSQYFSGAHLLVLEVKHIRDEDKKEQQLICHDYLGLEKSRLLAEQKTLKTAYDNKAVQCNGGKKKDFEIIVPVVLYDQTVSHLIQVTHQLKANTEANVLMGVMKICGDIFRSLHEKSYDPLTRILNRQAFDQMASNIAYTPPAAESDIQPDKHYRAVAILDIDNFKEVNDQFGHAIGDEILVLFTQTICSVLRQDDLFFRYGGEEFVILVKDVDVEQAQLVLERCREVTAARRFPQVGQVTVSIGFSRLEPQSHPVENLNKADKALYFAKQNGRNQVASYEQLLSAGLISEVEPLVSEADFWDE